MPGDGIVQLGAEFDKTNVEAGLGSVPEMVKAAVDAVSSVVVEAGAKEKAAWKGLSDGVKAGVASVTAEQIKLAESSRAVVAAQADVYRAITLTKSAALPASETMAILAAAQTNLAARRAADSAAAKAAAASVAAANEKMALSSNVVIAAFQEMGRAVKASLEGIQEKLVATGETARISVREMASGFSGLGELLGAGLVVGFATHTIDELVKMKVELGHMSEQTGISFERLSGLGQLVKNQGGEFEGFTQALFKMTAAQYQAAHGSEQLMKAFTDLGISEKEVIEDTPEQMLQRLAIALQQNEDIGQRNNAVREILARGGLRLIPILKQEGENLLRDADAQAKLLGATEKSLAVSQEWTRNMAELSGQMQALGNMFLLILPKVEAVGATIGAALDVPMQAAYVSVKTLTQGIYDLGKVQQDLITLHWGDMAKDYQAAVDHMNATNKGAFEDIKSRAQEAKDLWTGKNLLQFSPPPSPKGGIENPDDAEMGAAARASLKKDEEELNAMKIAHRMNVDEIRDFWQKKFAAAKEGSDEYFALQAKVAALSGARGEHSSAFKADEHELDEIKRDHRVEIEEELKFWETKLKTAKQKSDEYYAIVHRLAELQQEEDKRPKLPPAQPPTPETPNIGNKQESGPPELEKGSPGAEYIAELQEQVKATENATKEEMQAYRDLAEEQTRLAHEDYVDVEKDADFQVQMGRMSAQGRIQALRKAAEDENRIRMEQSKFIEMLDLNDTKKYAADKKKEEQDGRDFARQMKQLNDQTALDFQKAWDKATSQFNEDVAKWVVTGKGFEKSMAQMWAGISENMIKNLLKMMEQELLAVIQGDALNKQQIISAADSAAAKSYNWASGWGGPIAGAIAAATAFAGVMAFDSFAAGGVVQGGGGMAVPILAHAGERVLSPSQSSNFERMVNQSSSSKTVNQTNHLTQNLNGYDRAGMKAALRDHADDILDIVQSGYRSGALSPS